MRGLILVAASLLLSSSAQALFVPHIKACTDLEKEFPNDVSYPGDISYSKSNTYWASNTAAVPDCIFKPRNPQAAATALPILIKHDTNFAIRSGGHAFNPGWSTLSSGVQINLERLNQINLSDDRKTVVLGAGLRWSAVYDSLGAQGLSVPGGRAASVGTGGLSLGGGLSFFLYERGFGCDNIDSYTVALASGKVVRASAGENSDLFLALKGSGAPFAIVTDFTYRTVEIDDSGDIWGGFLTSTGGATDALLDGVAEFCSSTGGITDNKSHLIATIAIALADLTSTLTPIKLTTLAINILFYRDPTVSSSLPPRAFEPQFAAYKKAPLSSTVKRQSISALTKEIGGTGKGLRQLMYPVTVFNPTSSFLRAAERAFREELTITQLLSAGLSTTLNMIPVGSAVGTPETNLMGLDNSGEKRYLVIEIYAQWLLPIHDAMIHRAAEKAGARIKAAAQQEGLWDKWIYMNYADASQDPIKSYGPDSIALLKTVQNKYDPDRVWERLVKGGFKIPQ